MNTEDQENRYSRLKLKATSASHHVIRIVPSFDLSQTREIPAVDTAEVLARKMSDV